MMGSLLRRTVFFALAWWIAVEGSLDAWPLACVGIGLSLLGGFQVARLALQARPYAAWLELPPIPYCGAAWVEQ